MRRGHKNRKTGVGVHERAHANYDRREHDMPVHKLITDSRRWGLPTAPGVRADDGMCNNNEISLLGAARPSS